MKHAPRKRFGQHFLTDSAVIARILDEVDPQPGDAVVEIGPGLGAMTQGLASRCGGLIAIEIDRDLATRLRRWPSVQVIEADILKVELLSVAALAPGGASLRIVGNLPYNISSPILFHLLPWAAHVRDQHFMLQREVVQRMVAGADGRDYGRLSVMLQWRYEMERVLDVGPQAFDPPPAVESAVVRMRPRTTVTACAPQVLEELVRRAFSQRRKLLRHALARWLADRGIEDFDLQRRAEEVPVSDYLSLAERLST